MRNAISILGSTGSIGRQTLEVAESLGLKVLALSADRNIDLLELQARKYRPEIAAVFDGAAARDFQARVRDLRVKVVSGISGLVEVACIDGAETVVAAATGTAGLLPALEAIGLGRRIAIANKETIVCAGDIVMRKARESNAEIIPVDSEHSALFQCLRGEASGAVRKLILTASGGPFRGMGRAELAGVTPEMALRHPNWKMGKKITIDSATLMNKGLEVIEATHLFGVTPDMVQVVIHPESIIHSMVEFTDNSIKAQLSLPDMRLPIQYALTYPQRLPSLVQEVDIPGQASQVSTASLEQGPGVPGKFSLTFEAPDMEAFPCLGLALGAAGAGGTSCAVLNGANEAAVELFLRGELSFYGIYESVLAALENIGNNPDPALEDIIEAGAEAKRFVYGVM